MGGVDLTGSYRLIYGRVDLTGIYRLVYGRGGFDRYL